MAYTISNNRLLLNDQNVPFDKSPNGGGNLKPRFLIIHYTAGMTANGAISWFNNPAAKASAHLVMDQKGALTQMIEFNRVAWHAGNSSWHDFSGLNHHSIGIEIVNAGKLQKNAKGKWVNWANNAIDEDEVLIATHKNEKNPSGWHMFTEAQIEATVTVGIALREKYDLIDVLGHDDISPARKVDPGPAFPMLSVQSKIMGRDD